jgi:asparagine synthase (glutamine-hydrolysing)
MCGIAGIFELDSTIMVDEKIITNMCKRIIYRGPDDGGAITGNGFGMGARRLAILDISPMGHMPMKSDDGRYLIVYNGEVYNFQDIKDDLVSKGLLFQTSTDTEVVLKSYLYYGPDCLNMFNGMFAFAIYDTVGGKVFIARDRLGIKPLYYSKYDKKVIIASEIKCFWEANVPKKFNSGKFVELFSFRYVAGEDTIYENIFKLSPGHYLEIENGNIKITQWWNLGNFALNKSKLPATDTVEWYRKTFNDSVRLRKISDVPVGVLLSGGLDSSSVAASMATIAHKQVSSFTVRFAEEKYDEGNLAQILAKKYELDFNQLYLDPSDLFRKTVELLEKNDEPIFHASDLFVKEISAFAKSKVTVLLSGEGGDETLGGYVRYNPLRFSGLLKLGFIFRSFLSILPISQGRITKLIRMLSLKNIDNFILYNSSEILPEDLVKLGIRRNSDLSYRRLVLREAKKAYPNDPLRQVMHYDMQTFLCSLLERNDLMTMRSSIECRVPFLDFRLVEGLAALPSTELFKTDDVKSLLRRALGDKLPIEILNAKKWGFAVPWAKYYRENSNFKGYISNLSKHKLVAENFNDPQIIDYHIQKFLTGDDSGFSIINQLTNICLWYDINFENKDFLSEKFKNSSSIFYVGNFLSRHGLNPNFNSQLIPKLQERYNVVSASDKKSKILRLFDMANMLRKVHKKTDFVIIDVFSTDAFWFALILGMLAKYYKIPYINILRGGNLPVRLIENKTISRFLFKNAFKNISPSLYLQDFFQKEGYEVKYIPNFIEIDKYQFKYREKVTVNLFWLRAFHKIYNPVLAIKILKILRDKGYNAHLCMVGPDKDGSLQEVKKIAEELHIEDHLKITGRLNREEWIKESENYDIFINTTNFDNHPVSVLEAMAVGMPVISTNIGGLPFLIENGIDGILIPVNDEKIFADTIIDLVNNPQKAQVIAKNARKKSESFTWPYLKEKWLDVLG